MSSIEPNRKEMVEGRKESDAIGILLSPVTLEGGKITVNEKISSTIELLNRLVWLEYEGKPILATITSVETQNPYMDPGSQLGRGNMDYIKRYGQIPHTKEIDTKFASISFMNILDGGKVAILRNSPNTGATIRDATIKMIEKFYPLTHPATISVGWYRKTDYPWPLKTDVLSTLHVGIFGKTGTGKSHLSVILASVLRNAGKRVFIIDHTGDLAIAGTEKSDLMKCITQVKPITVNISEIRLDYELYLARVADPDFWKTLVMTTEDYLSRLLSNLRDGIEESQMLRSPDTISADRFLQFVRQAITNTFNQQTAQNHLATIDRKEVRIRSWYDSTILPYTRKPISYDQIVDELVKKKFVILNLANNEFSDRERYVHVAKVLEKIRTQAREEYERTHEPCSFDSMIFIDEAHNYAPQTIPEDAGQKRCLDIIKNLAKEGRKYGLLEDAVYG